MTIEYLLSFIAAIALLIAYLFMVTDKEFWLTTLYISVSVVNLGYTIMASADTLWLAILGNDVAYFGSVFLSMCMFLTIVRLVGFKVTKIHFAACLTLAILMFGIVATQGILPWYYESVSMITVDGSAKLVKVYGPLHSLYAVYLGGYFLVMIATIVHSVIIKKIGNPKLAGFIVAVVCSNIMVWLIEKFISWNFEMLSVTYIISEVLLLIVYWMMQDYVHKNDLPRASSPHDKATIIVVDSLTRAEKIEIILSSLPEDITLSARQTDILERILDGKSRKEIAYDLHLSENTVKTHTGMLYRTLGVSGRDEILAKFQK